MISRVAVVVPAADEQDEIEDCLAALRVAREHLHEASSGSVRARIVVVLDDCHDRTGEIVAGANDVEVVTSSARCVGSARRDGAAHALRADRGVDGLWLASTDADCRVPSDWLTALVTAANDGADLVLGTVRPASGLSAAVERAWLAAHSLGDDHPHVHGANLGISAAAYLRLGGWQRLPAHEDVDLVARAVADAHITIRRIGAAPVTAGIRRHGRVPNGFATYLRDIEDGLPAVS